MFRHRLGFCQLTRVLITFNHGRASRISYTEKTDTTMLKTCFTIYDNGWVNLKKTSPFAIVGTGDFKNTLIDQLRIWNGIYCQV